MQKGTEIRRSGPPSFDALLKQWQELEREAEQEAREAEEAALLATGDYQRRPDGAPGIWAKPKAERASCGAKTRAGGTCKAKAVLGGRRCRMHGGLSTGPKSEAGRAAIAESNRRRAEARRAQSS